TWNQIYETIAETISVEPNIIHIPSDFIVKHEISLMGSLLGDKSYSVIFDNSKIKKYVPGFTATISFKEGIKRTIDWFEAKPERKIIRKETDEMMDRIIRLYEKNI
ncbi:MAG: NAD-dependent dehydratase, partial [Melioribacter sp.]|nr:NAD-dependent dehydratase [Melioribacter sp.]